MHLRVWPGTSVSPAQSCCWALAMRSNQAHAQTGSGKTHTMEGPAGDRGINARTLAQLFELAAQRAAQAEHIITISCIEVSACPEQWPQGTAVSWLGSSCSSSTCSGSNPGDERCNS